MLSAGQRWMTRMAARMQRPMLRIYDEEVVVVSL
jgi:hypothetical protein